MTTSPTTPVVKMEPMETTKTKTEVATKATEEWNQPRIHEVGRFWSAKGMSKKSLTCLQNLYFWYSEENIQSILLPLIHQKDQVSLRALDWLVTNFAKKNTIVLVDTKEKGPPINIHLDYCTMLDYWKRKNFDPFRRHQRIYFQWENHIEETTVGQLNFFYWAHTKGIIQYAKQNTVEINNDMANCMREAKELKKQDRLNGIKRKRRELSQAPKRFCHIYPVQSRVNLEPEHVV